MYTVTAYYSLFDLYTIFNPLKKGLISMKTNINRMKEKKNSEEGIKRSCGWRALHYLNEFAYLL